MVNARAHTHTHRAPDNIGCCGGGAIDGGICGDASAGATAATIGGCYWWHYCFFVGGVAVAIGGAAAVQASHQLARRHACGDISQIHHQYVHARRPHRVATLRCELQA